MRTVGLQPGESLADTRGLREPTEILVLFSHPLPTVVLLCVVITWYYLETSVGDVHHEEEHCDGPGIYSEDDETLFSFPAPV